MKNIYSLESVWGKLLFIIVIFLHILLASPALLYHPHGNQCADTDDKPPTKQEEMGIGNPFNKARLFL